MLKEVLKEQYGDFISCDNLIRKTLILVEKLFEGKTDKSGKPYIGHLKRVASSFDDETYIVVSLLHDTLEDTSVTEEELASVGYSSEILEALVLLSRKEEDYNTFIDRIINSENNLAISVKIKDMEDNMDENRLCLLEEKEALRLRKKYSEHYPKLINCLKESGKKYVRH